MIYRYDILANKSFPVGKRWIYKVDIADEFYIGNQEIEIEKTSFYITNEMIRHAENGNMLLSVEISKMYFGALPNKLNSFLNRIINLNEKFILELNKNGQIVDFQIGKNKPNEFEKNEIHKDEFYESLTLEEKLIIDDNLKNQDRLNFKHIKKNLILLFCYPGYFREGLSGEYALETHSVTISSNFLEGVDWEVQFNMNIHNINHQKEIELICTGDVTEGTAQEEALLYQKIHNHFNVDGNEIYTDYTFVVMSDYILAATDFLIKKASINICETLNDEEIEFNKNIEIKLVDNFES